MLLFTSHANACLRASAPSVTRGSAGAVPHLHPAVPAPPAPAPVVAIREAFKLILQGVDRRRKAFEKQASGLGFPLQPAA